MKQIEAVVLQEIINLDGDCLHSERCGNCPLKAKCLPRWLRFRPTQRNRVRMALDTLTREAIMEDTDGDT